MTPRLGAEPVPGGVHFAVRARDAAAVELCLFHDTEETRLDMQREGDIFSLTVPGTGIGQRYNFRAHGDWNPEQGLFFDPAKLLMDPYARQLDERFIHDPRLAQRGEDTAALVPKAIVTEVLADKPMPAPLFKPGQLIYELNVRGFTINHPRVPAFLRGTVAALAHPDVIAHLQKLRVGAVELMPIVAWIDERHLPPLGLHNVWGYNPVVPMALDPGLVPGGVPELCATVAALRAAGIGVILDLVFNHTGESDLAGPVLSLRGLDNRCYARAPDGSLVNDTGTGNTLNAADGAVRDLILESLRHFARCGVDGFRFDLATVLARDPAFDPRAPIFDEIAQDPLLQDRVMVAEPWDVGPGGYQLGQFPPNWLEWNDRYRDDVRRFWRGDPHTAGVLATRMMGSSDIFRGDISRSVNFVAAHDGFTLADLVSYATKHNDDNGEANRDGQGENYSWNNGVEGATDDPAITGRRKADVKALLATLFASRGTLMLCAGDEFGRTQLGNNNAYAQDNKITRLDWQDRDTDLEDFVCRLAAARAEYLSQDAADFVAEAEWRDLDGEAMTPDKWNAGSLAGFEARIPLASGKSLLIRLDRSTMQCIVTVVGSPEATR
jgi:glycogen operon protein